MAGRAVPAIRVKLAKNIWWMSCGIGDDSVDLLIAPRTSLGIERREGTPQQAVLHPAAVLASQSIDASLDRRAARTRVLRRDLESMLAIAYALYYDSGMWNLTHRTRNGLHGNMMAACCCCTAGMTGGRT